MELKWNVLREVNDSLEPYNIFKCGDLYEFLLDEKKKYKKALKKFAEDNGRMIDGDIIIEYGDRKYSKFVDDYKNNIFAKAFISKLKYYFWAKAECELVISDLLPTISNDELNRINSEKENRYRHIVNLEHGTKIDIWDQLNIN